MGRYVRALLREWLAHERSRARVTLLVPQLFPSSVVRALHAQIGAEDVPVRHQRASRAMDVVWVPWNGLTWKPRSPVVATIHDLWPFVSPSPVARRRLREQTPYRATAKHAQQIIAVSEATKSEVVSYLHVLADRVTVIPHGVSRFAEPSRLPSALADIHRFVLFVGEAEGRKDLATLASAMALLPESLRQTTALVIAGRSGVKIAAHKGFRLEAVGEVDDARLAALYAAATVFVLPSRYEGFGMPVLEAMSYATPVIASDAAAIPEAGGDAALYFRCGDPAALRDRLVEVLTEPARAAELVARGARRAAAMTWTVCARRTLAALETAAAASAIGP